MVSEQRDIESLTKRLRNTEIALIGLVAIISDTLPPAYADSVHALMTDYFNHSQELEDFGGNEFVGE